MFKICRKLLACNHSDLFYFLMLSTYCVFFTDYIFLNCIPMSSSSSNACLTDREPIIDHVKDCCSHVCNLVAERKPEKNPASLLDSSVVIKSLNFFQAFFWRPIKMHISM